MTSIGSQGSLERTPGALFRAMGTLFLGEKDCTRESLSGSCGNASTYPVLITTSEQSVAPRPEQKGT